MKKLIIGCVIALWANSAYALKYALLLKNEDEKDVAWSLDRAYIRGVGQGFVLANAMMLNEGKKPMYCQPGDLVLDETSYIHLIKKTAQNYQDAMGKKFEDDDFGVERLLLLGLKNTFPCK